MQYRIIINTGSAHSAKEIANTVDQLRRAVQDNIALGRTIIEVQTRERKTDGWLDWRTT